MKVNVAVRRREQDGMLKNHKFQFWKIKVNVVLRSKISIRIAEEPKIPIQGQIEIPYFTKKLADVDPVAQELSIKLSYQSETSD